MWQPLTWCLSPARGIAHILVMGLTTHTHYQAQCSLLWVVLMVSRVGSTSSSSKQLQDQAYEDLKSISFHIKNRHTEVSLYTCNNTEVSVFCQSVFHTTWKTDIFRKPAFSSLLTLTESYYSISSFWVKSVQDGSSQPRRCCVHVWRRMEPKNEKQA